IVLGGRTEVGHDEVEGVAGAPVPATAESRIEPALRVMLSARRAIFGSFDSGMRALATGRRGRRPQAGGLPHWTAQNWTVQDSHRYRRAGYALPMRTPVAKTRRPPRPTCRAAESGGVSM